MLRLFGKYCLNFKNCKDVFDKYSLIFYKRLVKMLSIDGRLWGVVVYES